ncbi:MAG: DUF3179 domain-containing protein [Cocleimonas sp.]|nr:DUF3179 domain-containing protein [Cocleimonas sp.]
MKNNILAFILTSFVISIATASPTKNGFDLANSTIPVSKILSGGPPRDGIPSIDKPKFIVANKASYLKPHDRVIGVEINGKARAYPIRILNWHEIVNDNFYGTPIAVTYCPLCGSGIVYESRFGGSAHIFGVSGLLYNSDVLLYDRETETLWSQILSKGISGKLVGKTLTIVPSSHTSWGAWKKRHPNTQVLSTDTGAGRNYNRSPYEGYDKGRETYFPIEFRSKKYHPKERVIGVTINGKHKVYPFSELAKLENDSLQDMFSGQQLELSFDVENRDGTIKNSSGRILPSINTFWFAWYAFHPDTKIFKADK